MSAILCCVFYVSPGRRFREGKLALPVQDAMGSPHPEVTRIAEKGALSAGDPACNGLWSDLECASALDC